MVAAVCGWKWLEASISFIELRNERSNEGSNERMEEVGESCTQ